MPFRLFFKTNTPFRSSCFSAQTSSKIHLVDGLVDGTARRWDRAAMATETARMLQYLAGRGGSPPAMRSICCSLPNEIQSFSLHDKLKPGISADVKRVLGVLATMTPPGPTLHLCNELRDQIMAGPSAPLARSPSATRIPAPFLSHPRARALLVLPTSNTLSPNTDNLSVCDISRNARARTRKCPRTESGSSMDGSSCLPLKPGRVSSSQTRNRPRQSIQRNAPPGARHSPPLPQRPAGRPL